MNFCSARPTVTKGYQKQKFFLIYRVTHKSLNDFMRLASYFQKYSWHSNTYLWPPIVSLIVWHRKAMDKK